MLINLCPTVIGVQMWFLYIQIGWYVLEVQKHDMCKALHAGK